MKPLRLGQITAALVIAAVAVTVPVASSSAASSANATAKPVVAGSRYLALGDSVAFGYREADNLPTPDYDDPSDFRGYPEELAAALGLRLTNAACPGETSASLIDMTAASNGCENHWNAATATNAPGGYRTLYPLHRSHAGSQLDFAKRFLTRHPGTRLVTLTVGANDAFLCRVSTSDQCVGEFADLRETLTHNLGTIFKALRTGAGYHGQIVVVDYYSLDYTDAFLTGATHLLNDSIAEAAAPYHVKVASGFDAFQRAAAQAGGSTCGAQLVTALTGGGCGVHPSVAGAVLLAHAVAQRVRK